MKLKFKKIIMVSVCIFKSICAILVMFSQMLAEIGHFSVKKKDWEQINFLCPLDFFECDYITIVDVKKEIQVIHGGQKFEFPLCEVHFKKYESDLLHVYVTVGTIVGVVENYVTVVLRWIINN